VFHFLGKEEGVKPEPTVFPEFMPTDATLRESWLRGLSKSAHQGCGHVRLMVGQPAAYGLKSADIPRDLVQSFYRYWVRCC